MGLKPRRFYERKGECSRFLASRISNEVQWDKMCEKENIPSWLHGKSCSQRRVIFQLEIRLRKSSGKWLSIDRIFC